jgi:hypothetical protein
MPPNSSRDLKVGPRVKQQKKKKVRARSLTPNILGVGGCARALGWDSDKFTPLPIVCFVPLRGDYIQMSLFPMIPSGSPKLGLLLFPNFEHLYLFEIKFFFKSVRIIFYIP